MKSFHNKLLIIFIVISLLSYEAESGRMEPWKRFKKTVKSFVKGILKENKKTSLSEEEYDRKPEVYAYPSEGGYGYEVHDYSPSENIPHYGEGQHYGGGYDEDDGLRYDEAVNVGQGKKVWSGKIVIPNFLRGNDDLYSLHDEHVVKGTDNRVGFRIAVPFLGDFQYLREIGPGKYTDNLGPGRFKYPGINDKREQEKIRDHYKQALRSQAYGTPYANQVGEGAGDMYGSSSGPEGHAVKAYIDKTITEEPVPDPLASLRNYPWHRRRR